jgi:rod shape-determining protein MreB
MADAKDGAIRLGMDMGTNTTVLAAMEGEKELKLKPDLFTSVCGYAKPGLLPGILPGNRTTLFGDEAIKFRTYLNLKWPKDKGRIVDPDAARDLIGYIRSVVDGKGDREIWAVIGSPSHATGDDLQNFRYALGLTFNKLLVVPEPFLAALGARDESRLGDPSYADPTKNSLFIDIGAGTSDLCMIQGYYPGPDDQVNINKAGNDVDKHLREGIKRKYPDTNLSAVSVTKVKEESSWVGEKPDKPIVIDVMVAGKPRKLEITELVGAACESILPDILLGIEEIVKRCNTEMVEGMLGNIIVTGGGSLIGGICPYLQNELRKRGYVNAKVDKVKDYKRLVARGALKTGLSVRDDQWQIPSL